VRPVWLASGGLLAALVCTQGPPGLPLLLATSGILGALLAAATRRPALAAVLVGVAVIALRVALGDLLREPPTAVEASTEGRWSAQVLAVASPRDGEQRATLGLDLADGSAALVVYASLPRYPALTTGDRLQVAGLLRPPPSEGGFADYLRRNGVSATLQGRSMELGTGAGDLLQGLRRRLDELLAKVLPEPHAGLASGLLVGLRERVDRDLAADFTTAGVSHVVAISGWNIALVGGLVGALTRPLGRRPRSLLIVAVVAFYTVIAGASASVVRAALMAAVVLLARESGRRGQAAGALGLAACAMLLIDPSTVSDPGFQLSLAATGGLLAWGEPLRQGLVRRLPALPGWLVESLAISLAAQAATLPLVLFTFGRLSLVAPLANLLMAPVVGPAMLAGFVALLVGGLAALGAPAAVTAVGTAAGWAVLSSMIAIARLAASVPLASVELPQPWSGIGAAIAAMLLVLVGSRPGRERVARLWALARRGAGGSRNRAAGPPTDGSAISGSPGPTRRPPHGTRDRRPALAGLLAGVVLLAAVGFAAAARPDARLRMTVLDVGQGDAVLLEGPAGGRILVDGGPDPDLLLRQLDARLPAWDRRLDLVILTHPHEDHVAGLALLLDRYQVSATAEPGMLGPGPGYAAFRAALRRYPLPHRSLFRGDRLTLDGARIEVAWPIAGTVSERPPDDGTGINNVSIVLDVRFGHRRWLLNGDAEQDVDPSLLAGGLGGRVDVLKVAHHGSRTASTAAFLEAVRPAVAIVSAGSGNPYGHPAAATLDRLRAAGARVLRTDQDGSVTVSTDGEDQRVAVSGARRESGWLPAVALGYDRVSALRTPGAASGGWSCGVPLAPRIARWSSPTGTKPPGSSLDSTRPTGTGRTPPLSPTWPPSWRYGRLAAVGPSTAGWSRPPPSSTTSTSSSRRPSAVASPTGSRVPAG
jgi:competence protein ComEC